MKLSQAKAGQLLRLRWSGGGFALGEQPAWLSGEKAKQNGVDFVVGLQKLCSLRVHHGLMDSMEIGVLWWWMENCFLPSQLVVIIPCVFSEVSQQCFCPSQILGTVVISETAGNICSVLLVFLSTMHMHKSQFGNVCEF